MKKSTLVLKDLAVGYHQKGESKVVLSQLQTKLNPGHLVALLGPNGVGKSTLLRTMAGIAKPISGSVLLNETDINNLPLRERAQAVSLVLTGEIATTNLTVRELVSLGRIPYTSWSGRLSTEDQRVIEQAISWCNIGYLAQEKVGQISDGQRQKAMIARALTQDGPIMLLDEPTAHLDLPNKAEIMHLLRKLAHQRDKAILVSTHDLHLSLQFADHLWLASCENPIIEGLPEDLMVSGKLGDLFSHPAFKLDLNTGQFLTSKVNSIPINLKGTDSPAKTWALHALQKYGYYQSVKSTQIIQVTQHGNYLYQGEELCSIQQLLTRMNQ